MAEGFDSAYHVPQQSRREKLRVQDSSATTTTTTTTTNLYDPSSHMFSSDLLTCAAFKTTPNSANNNVKEERRNLMGYISSNSSSSTTSHNFYMDPPSLQDFNDNNNPYLILSPSNIRVLDQSLNFNNNRGPGVLSNGQGGLSLSLSSQQQQQQQQNVSVSSTTNQLQERYNHHHSIPLGPFTGYASILKGSRFLKPAQQMLEEICDVGGRNNMENITGDSGLLDPLPSSSSLDSLRRDEDYHGVPRNSKKSKLLWMLDEVYRRYKQYYQQMQAVVASFESVAGLSNAAPFANLALRAMSKHFGFLKDAITDQLQFTNGQINCANDEMPRTGDTDACLYVHKPIQTIGFNNHQPVWRPQRGLPERAVTVLRAWLFEHFLHPYPTDTDKLMLAKQTGLSRNQVSNWFINARVRLWKPMVEEIHTLEITQGQKPSQKDQQKVNNSSDHMLASQNPSTSTQRVRHLSSKRTRDDYSNNIVGGEATTNVLYGHPHTEIGMNGVVGNGGDVSLTLGLHQNNGMGITTEPFAMNADRRFGLEAGNEGLVMGHFEAQSRQFSRDYMGGQVQLLHDFVG